MLAQYLIGAGVAYVLLKLVRWFLAPKSPLDNVNGPPVPSWIAGQSATACSSTEQNLTSCSLFLGHMLELYDKQLGWNFHHELRTKYGPVSKLQFLFGVSGFTTSYEGNLVTVTATSDNSPIETATVRLRSYSNANYCLEGAPPP